MTIKSISILQLSFSSVFVRSSKLHCRIAVQDTQFKIVIVSQVRDEERIGSGFTCGTSCCPSNSQTQNPYNQTKIWLQKIFV